MEYQKVFGFTITWNSFNVRSRIRLFKTTYEQPCQKMQFDIKKNKRK